MKVSISVKVGDETIDSKTFNEKSYYKLGQSFTNWFLVKHHRGLLTYVVICEPHVKSTSTPQLFVTTSHIELSLFIESGITENLEINIFNRYDSVNVGGFIFRYLNGKKMLAHNQDPVKIVLEKKLN